MKGERPMSVSYDLFSVLKEFDDFRREKRTEYLKFKKDRNQYKGSSGYNSEMKAAAENRKQAVDAARKTASKKIDECLRIMRENIGKVAFIAPSPEQVAILQILSLKHRVSKTELDRAAKSMNGNSLALSALNDIADKHYFIGSDEGQTHTDYNLFADDLTEAALRNYINSVVADCRKIFETSANRAAYNAAKIQKANGINIDFDSLPQREPLVSERDFYGSIVAEKYYDSFMKAVNG